MGTNIWGILREEIKSFFIAWGSVWTVCIVSSLCLGAFGWSVVWGLLWGGLLAAGYLVLLALAVSGMAGREPQAAKRFGILHYLLRYAVLALGLYAAFTTPHLNPYCTCACLLVPKLACYGEAARLGASKGRRASE